MTIPSSLRANAYHEAGHAVAALLMGTGLMSVDIRPQSVPGGGIGRAGTDLARPPDDEILGHGEDAVMPYLVVFFSGVLAEALVNPGAGLEASHSHSDGAMVLRYATGAVCTPVREGGQIVFRGEEVQRNINRIEALMEKGRKRAEHFVASHRQAITAVATALLEKQILASEEVHELVTANLPPIT